MRSASRLLREASLQVSVAALLLLISCQQHAPLANLMAAGRAVPRSLWVELGRRFPNLVDWHTLWLWLCPHRPVVAGEARTKVVRQAEGLRGAGPRRGWRCAAGRPRPRSLCLLQEVQLRGVAQRAA